MFNKSRKNIVFFTDGTWYDGNVYSINNNIDYSSSNYINNSEYINDILTINNMIISNNYYNVVKE